MHHTERHPIHLISPAAASIFHLRPRCAHHISSGLRKNLCDYFANSSSWASYNRSLICQIESLQSHLGSSYCRKNIFNLSLYSLIEPNYPIVSPAGMGSWFSHPNWSKRSPRSSRRHACISNCLFFLYNIIEMRYEYSYLRCFFRHYSVLFCKCAVFHHENIVITKRISHRHQLCYLLSRINI